eukprot:11902125-Alexandrium_andersonii.AAC.1
MGDALVDALMDALMDAVMAALMDALMGALKDALTAIWAMNMMMVASCGLCDACGDPLREGVREGGSEG